MRAGQPAKKKTRAKRQAANAKKRKVKWEARRRERRAAEVVDRLKRADTPSIMGYDCDSMRDEALTAISVGASLPKKFVSSGIFGP